MEFSMYQRITAWVLLSFRMQQTSNLELRAYIVRRLLLLIPVLFGVTLFIFGITMLFSPVQRATLYVRDASNCAICRLSSSSMVLTGRSWVQYGTWLGQVFRGNLGWSKMVSMPVWNAIWHYLPATLELAIFATPLIILIGIFFGTKAAAHKDKPIDHATRVLAIVGWSLPTFWLGCY
jgi:ABC-type dipeptide/oligopeptide/nickel transport system permease component